MSSPAAAESAPAMLEAALKLARAGFPIFPANPKTKAPMIGGPGGFRHATTDEDQIRNWWTEHPNALIGYAPPRGTIIVDADTYKPGCEFDALEAKYGRLPFTLTVRTARGGTQYHFCVNGAPKLRTGENVLGKYVDVKGDGDGYGILPPSSRPGIGIYTLEDTGVDYAEEAPDWIVQRLLDKDVSKTKLRRFTRAEPCPICGGGHDLPHGRGIRCYGYLSSDGAYGHCTREQYAGALEIDRNGTTYAHRLGPKGCKCGVVHGADQSANQHKDPEPVLAEVHRSDKGNGIRFANQHRGRVLYSEARGTFLVFDGRRFVTQATCQAEVLAKQTVEAMWAEAMAEPDQDRQKALRAHALKSESARSLSAMLQCARSEPGIAIEEDDLDRDAMSLNVINGTVDLETGELRPHDPADLISKLAPVEYHPKAKAPTFDACLRHFMQDDEGLIEFMLQFMGYCLTGSVQERLLFLGIGPTRTFKSTLVRVMNAVLGDYALTAQPELLLAARWARDGSGPSSDLARLRGARFVSCIETDAGKDLSIARVKLLTGTDRITARFLHANEISFEPTFKILLATNEPPTVKDPDEATWSRLVRIPFEVQVPQNEVNTTFFDDRLAPELPGILAAAVAGCRRWHQAGRLLLPGKINDAVTEYRAEEDVVGQFIEACCNQRDGDYETHGDLYRAFVKWLKDRSPESKEPPPTTNTFGRRLAAKGFKKQRSAAAYRWVGLSLRGGVSE